MSHIHKPLDADQKDPQKAYHVVITEDNWVQGVWCGELEQTGEMVSYSYFSVPELRCTECGTVLDASDWDRLHIGRDCTIAGTLLREKAPRIVMYTPLICGLNRGTEFKGST